MNPKTNPASVAKRILLRFALYFSVYWLLQLALYDGQISNQVLAIIAMAMVLLSFIIDWLLSPDHFSNPGLFDPKRLRHALQIAIGVTTGFAMSHYARSHTAYSVGGWIMIIPSYLIGGFIGGYGPIELVRTVTGSWRRPPAVS